MYSHRLAALRERVAESAKDQLGAKAIIKRLSDLDEIKTQEIFNIISQDYKNLDCIIHNAARIEKMSNIFSHYL